MVLHIQCASISVEQFVEMKKRGQIPSWCCVSCSNIEGENRPKSNDQVMAKLDLIITSMNSKFECTNEAIKEIKSSQEMISAQYDDIIIKLQCLNTLKHKVEHLEKQLEEKDQKIKKMEERLRHQEQYSRVDMIELREVLEKPGEKIEEVVVKVIQKMDVTFTENDIEVAHRLKSNPGKTRGIIVKLKSRKKKTEILQNRRRNVTNHMVFNEGSGMIYVSHSLSPFYRNLLMKAKQMSRELGFKYCWFGDEKILIKRSDDSSVIIVRDESDLSQLTRALH